MSSKLKKKEEEDDEFRRTKISYLQEEDYSDTDLEKQETKFQEMEEHTKLWNFYEKETNLYNSLIEQMKGYTEQQSLPLIENITHEDLEFFFEKVIKK